MAKQDSIFMRFGLIVLMLSAVSCSSSAPRPDTSSARAWPEAEALFHQDPRWLGADAALSIPLANGRTVWLFGDSFIARSNTNERSQSTLVRNTIAIQTGADPRTASAKFHWQEHSDGSPAPFFPGHGERWYWPGHGVRLEHGPLLIFLYAMAATPGQGLGFASEGHAVAIIDNPDAPAEAWHPRIVRAAPSPFDAIPATAVLQDGDYVVALAIRQEGTHAGALVRYPTAELAHGDLRHAEWWAGDGHGWLPESSLGASGPASVLDDAGAECSLHRDPRSGRFIHVASYGFGASTIALRSAASLTGPWSAPTVVYRPPESDGPRPFVYAAKAHPELVGPEPSDLVITYATNSFEFADLFTPNGSHSLYWPRFVAVHVGE